MNTVKIKNETDFELTDDVLNSEGLDIDSSNIVIFHTHTCESYTSSESYAYIPTGNFRTTDLNYSVARVGSELEKYLIKLLKLKKYYKGQIMQKIWQKHRKVQNLF